MTHEDIERFKRSFSIDAETGCWNWICQMRANGYGCFRVDGNTKQAHRISLEIANNQPIPVGMWALHKCDNRRCVNPDHLYLGTGTENNLDAYSRGRRSPSRKCGEIASNVKVTAHEAMCIRKHADVPSRVWAELFGISQSAVRKIRSGINWKDLQSV